MSLDIEEGLKLQAQVKETDWSSTTTSDFSNWLLENADKLFVEIITLRTQNAELYRDLRARNRASLTATDETDKALASDTPFDQPKMQAIGKEESARKNNLGLLLISFFLIGGALAFIVDSNFRADDACILGAVIFLIVWWRRKS